jgi:hypothetical protein
MKKETMKKRMSFTTVPLYFDDVKDDKFLAQVTEGFDDGEVYETSEVDILFFKSNFLIHLFFRESLSERLN